MLVGYVRSAPSEAGSDTQERLLRGAGCEVVFVEPVAAYPGQPQSELDRAVASLRPRDVLMVTALDRLAGGLRDLIGRIHQVQIKGASFRSLEGSTDTCTASSSQLLAALLSFDRQQVGERAQADARGAQRQTPQAGRPRLLDEQAVKLAAQIDPALVTR